MMQVSRRTLQPESLVNEIVVDVLSTAVLVLAGVVTIAQFAFY